MDSLPLWNDSSMGGIILYTLPKSSFRDKLAAMIADFCVYFPGEFFEDVLFQLTNKSINVQRREMLNECFCLAHVWMRSDDVGGVAAFWLIDLMIDDVI